MKRIISVAMLTILVGSISLFGQMKIGMDIYSRYIWRGIDFGNAPSYQPSISYSAGSLSFGAWGAFSTTGSYSENDLWASYAFETSSGTIAIYLTDYFFPSAGIKFLNYKGDGAGAHTLEVGAGYAGTESFPISLNAYYNFHNDVDKSIYIQAGYPISIDSVHSMTVFAGFTGGTSALYGTASAALLNIGATFSKSIKLSETFSIPVSASYIINPEIEQSYLIFGVSL